MTDAQGSVWVAPTFKNSESDDFGAQGAKYGVDLDMAGAALGADYTAASGVRVGAMFNVGSGSADGKGNGAGLSNDFDYVGFGVYAGATVGNLGINADVNYAVVSNAIEGESGVTGFGKLKSDVDSTVVSAGVTGEYKFATAALDVVPHAGLRFTRIDTDSYDVKSSKGTVLSVASDVQNIVSIPVGVTLSRDIVAGAWTVKPSADLTITCNTGDTDNTSTANFLGTATDVALTSEVLDDVTFGATLGLEAATKSFGFGVGVNYTGSSNVDEYGVKANARYIF